MLMLSPEQTDRLTALIRGRDLALLGSGLADTFPDVPPRLGERYAALIALGAERAAAHGLTHLACVARYLACWVVFGAEFEQRPGFDWARDILAASDRPAGARIFQLCRRVREQLQAQPQPGRLTPQAFDAALARLDAALRSAGDVGELGDRATIQIGAACDLDAVELRLVGSSWRQHYAVEAGQWRRTPCAPAGDAVTVRQGTDAALPRQITLLGQPPGADAQARLRLRTRAAACCEASQHPRVALTGDAGLREWRGPLAADLTLALPTPVPAPDGIAAEGSPAWHPLEFATCGLRDSGTPTGDLRTLLALYPAEQRLLGWRRDAPPAVDLPGPPPVAATLASCRAERDGLPLPTTHWQAGLQAIDLRLAAGLGQLLAAWERDCGVTDAGLAAEHAILCGAAGLSWGWAERPEGIGAAPFMRVVALFERLVCRLRLELRGRLEWRGSSSELRLTARLDAAFPAAWQRGPDDADLGTALAPLQLSVTAPFALTLVPLADAGLCTLSVAAPPSGTLTLQAGLRPRPDGAGLQWYARIAVLPVRADFVLHDPLLGRTAFGRPLLPALTLLDWTLH